VTEPTLRGQKSLIHFFARVLLLGLAICLINGTLAAQTNSSNFRVIVLAEHGGIHKPFVDRAKVWLGKLASENNFTVDYIEDTEKIDAAFLEINRRPSEAAHGVHDVNLAVLLRYSSRGLDRIQDARRRFAMHEGDVRDRLVRREASVKVRGI